MTAIVKKEVDYFTIKDGSEDGLDVEEIRYYSADSYDDNLDLIGYNADLRDTKTGRLVAVVDFNEGDKDFRVRECPHCLEYGFLNQLGVLLIKEGEKRPVDWDNWLQCHECGNKYGRFEILAQKTLKMNTERHEESNPFNAKESTFTHVPNRAEQRRKRELRDQDRKGVHKYRSKRIDYENKEDPDIQKEIDRHGSGNVRSIQ